MVALSEKKHHDTKVKRCGALRQRSTNRFAQRTTISDRVPDNLVIDHWPFVIERGTDGVWFTDDDVQSSYGANEIIFCGYPDGSGFRGLDDASPLRRRFAAPLNQHDPESELYYVRNRSYSPALGRWIQRDPIGYPDVTKSFSQVSGQAPGGVNLYEYVGGRAVVAVDPEGTNAVTVTDRYFCPPADPDFAFCFGNCTCTVGKPYMFGKLVNTFTVGMAMASVMLAGCVESCSVCTVFRSPRSQPFLMSEGVTLNVSEIFPFATTTCTCT